MTTKPKPTLRKPADAMAASDLRTQMVKEQTARENAEFDARTLKLRALRLAKEEADRAVAASHPAPEKPRRKRIT